MKNKSLYLVYNADLPLIDQNGNLLYFRKKKKALRHIAVIKPNLENRVNDLQIAKVKGI